MVKVFYTISIIIICACLIFGCGNSFPPENIAKNIATQFVRQSQGVSIKISDIQITNKFTQNFDGETYYVYEFAFSYGVGSSNYKVEGMQIAYILKGQKWYGKMIQDGKGWSI
jgi:hypothetical protein